MNKFLQINESGLVLEDGQPVSEEIAQFVLNHLSITPWGAISSRLPDGTSTTTCLIEAFDQPLIGTACHRDGEHFQFSVLPQLSMTMDLHSLCLDEWDRFHGLTDKGIPFVLNAEAQEQLFDLADSFSDEEIVLNGVAYPTPSWLAPQAPPVQQSSFWSQRYLTGQTGWEMNQPSPVLTKALPGLKLPKSRVLVLGCGTGEDAAEFARHGHLVTALDFADESLNTARAKFPDLPIQWVQADAFQMNENWIQSFDMIFEHTFYCAIHPRKRNDLVDLWSRYLAPGGYLFGVFFTMERREAPPFGGSEWEIRRRLKDRFQILHWQRSRSSVADRLGKELLVIAQKGWS